MELKNIHLRIGLSTAEALSKARSGYEKVYVLSRCNSTLKLCSGVFKSATSRYANASGVRESASRARKGVIQSQLLELFQGGS